MVITLDQVLAGALIVVLGVLHYIVHTRRMALMRRIRQLESLNAALGLRFIVLAEIIGRSIADSSAQHELNDLVRSTLEAFKSYHTVFPTGVNIDAGGNVNIGAGVTGGDKKQ